MFQGILALIQIIPRLVTLAERVGQWCIEKNLENRLAALESAFEKVEAAKTEFDNAYARYNHMAEAEKAGYTEARTEKMQAAQEMFTYAKDIMSEAKKEQDTYQSAMGKVYNPNTGEYEKKPGAGGGSSESSKMFAKADSLRKDLAAGTIDWGQAFNRVRAEFPNVDAKQIDDALGGKAAFKPDGTYDAGASTGFAKAGTRTPASTPANQQKEAERAQAFEYLDQGIANRPQDKSGAEVYSHALELYGQILSDSEIKARLNANQIYF